MPIEAYECTLSGTLAGQFVQTVINVALDNTGSSPPFQSALGIGQSMAAANAFIQKFTDALPAAYVCTSLRVRRVSVGGGPTAIILQSQMAQFTGQRDLQISSAQVSPLIIIIPTSNPNRTGRIFMPGVAENDIDAMAISAGLNTALQNLILHMGAGDTSPEGVFVYGVLRRALHLVDPMADAYVSPLIGTQRRRLRPV